MLAHTTTRPSSARFALSSSQTHLLKPPLVAPRLRSAAVRVSATLSKEPPATPAASSETEKKMSAPQHRFETLQIHAGQARIFPLHLPPSVWCHIFSLCVL